MNLFWLKYVSYAFVAGAALLYIALRLNWPAITRTTKTLLYVACIVMACVSCP